MENALSKCRLPDGRLIRLMLAMDKRREPMTFFNQRIYRSERSFYGIIQMARRSGWLEEKAEYLNGAFVKSAKLTDKGVILASVFRNWMEKNNGH